MSNWNTLVSWKGPGTWLESWHDWLLRNWSRLVNWKGPAIYSSPLNSSKDFWRLLSLLISFNSQSLVAYWVLVEQIYSKMHHVSCTNAYHEVTVLVDHEMIKNTKSWTYRERNITFLRNKIILNVCLIWHILRYTNLIWKLLHMFVFTK